MNTVCRWMILNPNTQKRNGIEMKKNTFVLNELLWEFTLSCNKNCKYCGSKALVNKEKEAEINRKYIAKEIAAAKPKEVTFTGGEPSVLMKELDECAGILCKKGIKCKVLTNGNLFKNKLDDDFNKKFECFGYSINELEDIENAMSILTNIPREKTTIVTNFGTHNIDIFEKIAKFALMFPVWQVQLTMGNEFQLDLPDIESLIQKVNTLPNNMIKVVRADNFNCGDCYAGISCCSITWDGNVIPCLSYRAWKSDVMSQGNVFKDSLEKIWKNKFHFFRTRQFCPCCKNISGIKEIENKNEQTFPEDVFPHEPNSNPPPAHDKVFVYGVVTPKPVVTYGVADNTIIVYGVFN